MYISVQIVGVVLVQDACSGGRPAQGEEAAAQSDDPGRRPASSSNERNCGRARGGGQLGSNLVIKLFSLRSADNYWQPPATLCKYNTMRN